MASNLQVFLISPAEVVVYSFDNPHNNDNYIYNADSLELISDPEVVSYREIAGTTTADFNTNPIVLGYANGLFEIVYAPEEMDYLFRSDGSLASHEGSRVIARTTLKIPNIEQSVVFSQKLTPLELAPPNEESIKKYIHMSRNNREYNAHENYWEMRSVVAEKSLPDLQLSEKKTTPIINSSSHFLSNPLIPEQRIFPSIITDQPTPVSIQPTPTPEQAPSLDVNVIEEERFKTLQSELEELWAILKAITQRLYKIYPVELPSEIKMSDRTSKVTSVDDIKEKLNNNQIESMDMLPLLQAYAGSHRSNNRLLTFYATDGEIYHVKADYDAKTNNINEPKVALS